MTDQLQVLVAAELDGMRADAAIAQITGATRSWAAEIIARQAATQNGKILRKSDKLIAHAALSIAWADKPQPKIVPAEIPDMQILHDDDEIVVVSKPPGVAAHPSLGWEGTSVLDGLAARGYAIATSGVHERQGIVHRLDQGTSGVMVVAKSEYAYAELKRQFKAREVRKVYHTVVHGHPDPFAGTIDAPIGRDAYAKWRFAVTADGRHAVTHYETIEAFRHATLLEIGLETGRTHQIRVHMSAQRHPCIGDITYGADPTLARKLGLERQWLHAVELEFTHPGTAKRVTFTSDYSEDLHHALDMLAA